MSLEEILQILGSKKPFLNTPRDDNGTPDPFTASGAKAYDKLTEILYAVGELTETDMNGVVEALDAIANEF